MKKLYVIFFAVIFNISATFADANPDLKAKLCLAVDNYAKNHFLNASYVFADDNEVLKAGAQGYHTFDTEKKLSLKQQMPVASTTKSMTAVAILKLQEKGLLNVNDLVMDRLPKQDKNPAWAGKVTIHHLLTHTSGVAEYFMKMPININQSHRAINKDILNYALSNDLSFEPGSEYNYCNTNFVLLGLIIENVSGMSVAKFFQEELFNPLGMKHTKLASLQDAIKLQTMPPYFVQMPQRYFVTPNGTNKPVINAPPKSYVMVPYADGGVVSTASDLVKWQQAIHNKKIISEETYKLMTTKYYKAYEKTGVNNYIGYGLFISELENGEVVYHHAGRAIAIRSESGYIPSKNVYFSVLSNVMEYIPDEFKDKIDLSKPENQVDIHYFVQDIYRSL